jgi:hypothetical protein
MDNPSDLLPESNSRERLNTWVAVSVALLASFRSFEKQYDALNFRDDQFDLSDAVLSVSIATLAITSLHRKKWLLWMSLVLGAFGVVMGAAGLFGLSIHQNWLIKLHS